MLFFSMTEYTAGRSLKAGLSLRSVGTWTQICAGRATSNANVMDISTTHHLPKIARGDGNARPQLSPILISTEQESEKQCIVWIPIKIPDLSYAEDVRNETTRPSTVPRTVSI
jgi:hypothetical protein